MRGFQEVEFVLVEEDGGEADAAIQALRAEGVANAITWLRDGHTAIDYVFRRGQYTHRETRAPTVILVSMNVGSLSALEVLRAIKSNEETNAIPIVLVKSPDQAIDGVEDGVLGVHSFIAKPIDFKSLMKVARNAGLHWMAVGYRDDAS